MARLRPIVISGCLLGAAGAAQAELRVCNDTDRAQSLSVGYKRGEGFVSEGWWNVDPGECVVPLGDDLSQRVYYLRAEHQGGPFQGGGHFFCTSPEAYEIAGNADCGGRKYDTEDFIQIDVGGRASYTHRLTQAAMDLAQNGDGLGLEFCNDTAEEHSVAVGYDGPTGRTSEGWWNIAPGECKKPLKDVLRNGNYYYRSEVRAGDFEGGQGYSLCTFSEAFTIVGDTNCEARGYVTEEFAKLDVGAGAQGYSFTITSRAGGRGTPVADTGSPTGTPTGGPSGTAPGEPGLNFCNQTQNGQSISIGYEGAEGWTSEGWWNVEPGACTKPLGGPLTNRYYYYRAEVDGGQFDGGGFGFCTTPDAYTILGDSDCEARGYEREDFAEIDIGPGADRYTLALTAQNAGLSDNLGLHFCNETAQRQSISIGYEGAAGWTSEGWWNVEPGGCATTLSGALPNRYYYYRAEVDGGAFDGENYTFCTKTEAFEIVGDTDCEARGYDKETFREIDIGAGVNTYTLTLVAPAGGAGAETDLTASETSNTSVIDVISETGAGIEVCNETTDTQSVSFGYEGAEGWTSEGWWLVEPGACATPKLDGVRHRYLYYRAEIEGGDFIGQNYFFCTATDAYTIVGDADCEARGYEREDFREIDIGQEGMFTLTLVGESGSEVASTPSPESGAETTLGDRFGGGFGTADPEPEADPSPGPDLTEAPGDDRPGPAAVTVTDAGIAFCNESGADRSVAVGYEGAEGWTSEGWWVVGPGECSSPELDGQRHRYIYYRAEDPEGGFDGQGYTFCTINDAFTIVGDTDCEARGYETVDFSELDIGSEGMFTVTLTGGEAVEDAPAPEPAPEPTPAPAPTEDPEDDNSFGGGPTPGSDPGTVMPGDSGFGSGTEGSPGGTGGFDFGSGDRGPEGADSVDEAPGPEIAPDRGTDNPRRGGSRNR